MIWDYIRDFLVQYIFGGKTSSGRLFGGGLGQVYEYVDGVLDDSYNGTVNDIFYFVSGDTSKGYSLTLGDWLSTTTTIIIMCVIVFLFALLVRWVFKAVTSAFLLK